MRHNREKDYFTAAAAFSEVLWEGAHCFREKRRRVEGMNSLENGLLIYKRIFKKPRVFGSIMSSTGVGLWHFRNLKRTKL